MEVDAMDGGNPSQDSSEEGFEEDVLGEEIPSRNRGESLRDFEARMDLMADGISQLSQAVTRLTQFQQPQAQVEDDDYGDDEPLTAKRVGKIVNKAISTAVSTSSEISERKQWDDRARSEFPIGDPKFESAFKKEWKSFQDAGGNINHPRAVYKVCSDTARLVGNAKPAVRRSSESEAPTGEVTTRPSAPNRRVSSSKISDDDNRVKFFRMRNSDPKAIENFKKKLEAKDQPRRATR